MIYKFIDNNGSEISVNSLESLQALVDSETINENTKVKAGLRGKWTTASEIEGLSFNKVEEFENIAEPEQDIKSFITQTEESKPKEENKKSNDINQSVKKVEKEDEVLQKEEIINQFEKSDDNQAENIDRSDYYNIKFQKKPLMIWIWISVVMIVIGGFLRIFTNAKSN